MVNNTPNSQNKFPVNPLENVPKEELQARLSAAQLSNNWEEAGKIIDELKRREKPEGTEIIDEFNKSYEELAKKVKSGKATKAELQRFFKKDLEKYRSGVDKTVAEISDYKDRKITELQKQLQDAVTDLPSITEYFSLKRRRLVNIIKHFDEFEKDTNNYPKNFLIYAMGMMNSSIFGIREKIKRGWIKMMWKRKSDDIKGGLQILEEKIKIQEGDSAQVKIIKQIIQERLVKAKNAYIEKIKENVF